MNEKEKSLEEILKSYANSLGRIVKDMKKPNLDFAFEFIYPDNKNNTTNQTIAIVKGKDADFIEFSCRIIITDIDKNAIYRNNKELVLAVVRKLILFSGFNYKIEPKINRIGIIIKLYLKNKNEITKQVFFEYVDKTYRTILLSVLTMVDFIKGRNISLI